MSNGGRGERGVTCLALPRVYCLLVCVEWWMSLTYLLSASQRASTTRNNRTLTTSRQRGRNDSRPLRFSRHLTSVVVLFSLSLQRGRKRSQRMSGAAIVASVVLFEFVVRGKKNPSLPAWSRLERGLQANTPATRRVGPAAAIRIRDSLALIRLAASLRSTYSERSARCDGESHPERVVTDRAKMKSKR